MASKPTQRSLAHLKREGWTVCIVEKFLPERGSMKFSRRIDASKVTLCKEHGARDSRRINITPTLLAECREQHCFLRRKGYKAMSSDRTKTV